VLAVFLRFGRVATSKIGEIVTTQGGPKAELLIIRRGAGSLCWVAGPSVPEEARGASRYPVAILLEENLSAVIFTYK
jgi:hypothetical protein